jgi:hypothetical protein
VGTYESTCGTSCPAPAPHTSRPAPRTLRAMACPHAVRPAGTRGGGGVAGAILAQPARPAGSDLSGPDQDLQKNHERNLRYLMRRSSSCVERGEFQVGVKGVGESKLKKYKELSCTISFAFEKSQLQVAGKLFVRCERSAYTPAGDALFCLLRCCDGPRVRPFWRERRVCMCNLEPHLSDSQSCWGLGCGVWACRLGKPWSPRPRSSRTRLKCQKRGPRRFKLCVVRAIDVR